MDTYELMVLTWYKGASNTPWVMTLSDSENRKYEVTVGDKGSASSGPRLEESLSWMDDNTYRYPVRYDMRQIENREARRFQAQILKERISYLESPLAFQKELPVSFQQTPFEPVEDDVNLVDEATYFESPRPKNRTMMAARATANTKTTEEFAPNSHIFWLFAHPQNVKVVDSTTLDIFIDAYSWPEGYTVPQQVGNQNILDSQRTVRVRLLGADSFSLIDKNNAEAAKRYNLYNKNKDDGLTYNPDVLTKAEKEARQYIDEFVDTQQYLAISLQYSYQNEGPIEYNGDLLGVLYGTSFDSMTDIQQAIASRHFRGVNINKSLLKEFYSKNEDVKKKFPLAPNIPLVEYVNQSEDHPEHVLSVVDWVNEAGIQLPPELDLSDSHTGNEETQEEVIERLVEEAVEEGGGGDSSDHYIEGYINNDLSFIPPKDDRLESGELYNHIDEQPFADIPEEEQAGALPYDYTHKVRIGDVMFEVPPLSIRATKQQANEGVSTIRSRNAMHKGVGTSRQTLTLDLYFHDLENINGHKRYAYTKDNGRQVFYYMDGLRTLLAQFIKSPFVPIDNYYINESLGVRNVAMQAISAQTVEGFPEALMVTLVLEEFDTTPYLLEETDLGMVMNYPLYRWYYQKALQEPETTFRDKTYLPEVENLDSTFRFQIANENFLSERTALIREFNSLKTPSEFKRKLEDEIQQESENGGENLSSGLSIRRALDSYHNYMDYYNSLSSSLQSTYTPSTLPIFTHGGEENLKDGVIQDIPSEELEIGLDAGKAIYGTGIFDGYVLNFLYEMEIPYGNEKRNLDPEDSIFIGTYQAGEQGKLVQIMKQEGVPGFLQVTIEDKDIQNRLRDLLEQAGDYESEQGLGGPRDYNFGRILGQDNFLVPAGTIGGINFISELEKMSSKGEEFDEEVEQYTSEYNEMVRIINMPEADIPMDDFVIENLTPIDLQVSLSNNLSMVQVQSAKTPTFQYLGAQQPEVHITFSTDEDGVERIDDLFRTIARYAKEYRTGLVSNFLTLDNPLVNLFGVRAVLPNTFDIRTVDGQPDEKIVTMIFTGFDQTQRKQEALYSFAGGKVSKEMKDLHLNNYDPQVDSLYVHEKMRHMELYPDLELPTYDELEADIKHLDSGVDKLENRTGQVYLDPDFYVSTHTTVRKQMSELLGDSRGTEVKVVDDTGESATMNAANNQNLSKDEKREDVAENPEDVFVNPKLIWERYSASPGEDAKEADEAEDNDKSNIQISSSMGELHKVKSNYVDVVNSLSDHGGENPDPKDVWEYLWNITRQVFGDLDEYVESSEDLMKVEDMTSASTVKAMEYASRSPLDNFSHLYISTEQLQSSGTFLEHGITDQITKDIFTGLKERNERLEGLDVQDFFSLDRYLPSEENDRHNPLLGLLNFVDFDVVGNLVDEELHVEWMRHDRPRGGSHLIPRIERIRIFMYMKTLLETESNWMQYDGNGAPYIGAKQDDGTPYKIGIMGYPLAYAEDEKHVRQLATDWKYNIKESMELIKDYYLTARNNRYGDVSLRPLDWGVAHHSGAVMPAVVTSDDEWADVPWNPGERKIAPEASTHFAHFSDHYRKTANSLSYGNPLPLFTAKDQILRDELLEETGVDEDGVDEYIEEAVEMESNNFDQYTLEDKIKHMYVDMQQHDQTGRFVRAFPTFSLLLIDEGKWYQNFRTWDNFYGYNALHSIDVYKSRKIAADTAVFSMSNMYGNLSSSHGSQSNPDLRLPSFFSSQFWEHYVFGLPTEQDIEQRGEQYDQILLQTGARVHLRMGYGADASYLPIVFNGSISEMTTDEVIEVVAQSDAVELQNVISGDPEDDNVGFMNRVQEPRKTIGELMTSKGNWIRDMINHGTNSTFFKQNASGIAHFGSTVHSEEGNRSILPGAHSEEFGESLQNVYSQNGMETRSQWHAHDGREYGNIEMLGKHVKEIVTNLSVLIGNTPSFDEDNIAVSYYGRTVWEVIQTFALTSQDYVAETVPFEFRSTLFFGKPHWMMQYRYDSDFVYDADREVIDRTVKKAHVKTFMQAHIYNSYHNIISNNVMASEDGVYNNVVVTYDGRQAGPVQADSDIRFDKQRTIDVEANILAPRTFEYFRSEDQALIYGQSTLRDFMKDMYKGEYSVIGDPTLKPYDAIFLNDHINDMNGVHLVKAVHHSMDGEHGFVSYIEPDAYVYNFDEEMGAIASGLFYIGKNTSLSMIGSAMMSGASLLGGAVVGKLIQKGVDLAAGKLAQSGTVQFSKKVGAGALKHGSAKFFEVAGNMFAKGGRTTKIAANIKSAQTTSRVVELIKAGSQSLTGEMSAFSKAGAAEQATFFQRQAHSLVNFFQTGKTGKAMGVAGKALTNTTKVLKGVLTSKVFWFAVLYVGFEVATATIEEWWLRKKQNAEAVKVVPLFHRGKRWTSLMNWHKGAVVGDDPSLKDKLMNAEFFDDDIDPEVNDIFGVSFFKTMNLLFG